jgi:hypothetical protein
MNSKHENGRSEHPNGPAGASTMARVAGIVQAVADYLGRASPGGRRARGRKHRPARYFPPLFPYPREPGDGAADVSSVPHRRV